MSYTTQAASVEVLRGQSYVVGAFADVKAWTVAAGQIWVCHAARFCNLTKLIETAVVSVVIRAYHALEGFPKPSAFTSLIIGHLAFA